MEPFYDYDIHNTPRPFTVLLDGGIHIETSTEETKIFTLGEVILIEDTTGKGLRSKNLEAKTKWSVFIGF